MSSLHPSAEPNAVTVIPTLNVPGPAPATPEIGAVNRDVRISLWKRLQYGPLLIAASLGISVGIVAERWRASATRLTPEQEFRLRDIEAGVMDVYRRLSVTFQDLQQNPGLPKEDRKKELQKCLKETEDRLIKYEQLFKRPNGLKEAFEKLRDDIRNELSKL